MGAWHIQPNPNKTPKRSFHPRFTTNRAPPPYSSASHSRYRPSTELSGPSSNDKMSLGVTYITSASGGGPDEEVSTSVVGGGGIKLARRESWKHVLAWNVCSNASVVSSCRSRRSCSASSWSTSPPGWGSLSLGVEADVNVEIEEAWRR